MARLNPIEAMRLAIETARRGTGFVSPNPLVGCVILDAHGELMSTGYHARLGGPHAEVVALNGVQDPAQLVGASVYVTLEPCAHHGRTPPCAEHLARLPIHKVVYGLKDPNPQVAGKGLDILRRAGKQVEDIVEMAPELEVELEELAEIFLFNQRQGRAFTAVKVATTLDGMMAGQGGESYWITSEESRNHVHVLRAGYDAIVVGKGTFKQDNPRLNVRHPDFPKKTNFVLVVDPRGEALVDLPQSELMKTHAPEKIIWITKQEMKAPSGVRVWSQLFTREGFLDWEKLTVQALREGLASLFVEGGPTLIGHLLEARVVDRWYQFVAPDLLGARHSLALGSGWGEGRLDQKVSLLRPSWRTFGRDLFVTARLSRAKID